MKQFTFVVEEAEADLIVEGLGKLAYERVERIVAKMRQQYITQEAVFKKKERDKMLTELQSLGQPDLTRQQLNIIKPSDNGNDPVDGH